MDPDEGWINVGTYRVMVHDEKSVGFYISRESGRPSDKYMARKHPCQWQSWATILSSSC
jgi:4-hydroxy-3-polyprenylbenzoate decarboxylase